MIRCTRDVPLVATRRLGKRSESMSLEDSQQTQNATSDTCMTMEQWVDHLHAETALSNILPCADQGTMHQPLYESKQVIKDLKDIVNEFNGIFTDAEKEKEKDSNNRDGRDSRDKDKKDKSIGGGDLLD
ncbi:hypothetical protein L2E82_20595 [Cichorium intybus]|uniref:Uncharacterized protein n=1 Tax=Cichorium intybus TaxID=13427 RepID=A0ACB9DTV4_CICIN|nr:hypothetical protein L2E82_20595 [Cichorium intybus]